MIVTDLLAVRATAILACFTFALSARATDNRAPDVPSGVIATAVSSSEIDLRWSPSRDNMGISGYRVYRNGALLSTVSTTTYAATGLGAASSYCFTVAAVDTSGNASRQSPPACSTTSAAPAASDSSAPSTPSLTVAAASSSQINLSWTASTDLGGSGVGGYRIYRNGSLLAATASTSYANTGLQAGTTYCYTVASYDIAGNSSSQSISRCATTTAVASDVYAPSVPSLTISVASSTQINLGWTASTDTGGSGLAGYRIYRNGALLATTSGLTYANSGLSAGVSYCYTIAAYDNTGNTSAQSASRCATTPAIGDPYAPSVPTLSATAASSSQINLSWTASTDTGGSGLAGYRIYRSGTLIAITAATSYGNTGLAAGASYCYTVAAYDNAGNSSAQSASRCATTTSACSYSLSATSASVAATGGSGSVTISGCTTAWTASSPVSWVTVSPASGSGAATINYTVQANTGTTARSATLTIAGRSFSVSQGFTGTSTSTSTWVQRFGNTGNDCDATVEIDSSGFVYAAGTFNGSVQLGSSSFVSAGARDIYLIKTSSAGVIQWAKTFGSSGDESVKQILLDKSGNIYLAGSFSGLGGFGGSAALSVGGTDCFIAKYSAQGVFIWSRTFGGTYSDGVYGIALDAQQQNVIATGLYAGTVTFTPSATFTSRSGLQDTFLSEYSATTGAPIWAKTFTNADYDAGMAVFVDAANNITLIGNFAYAIDLGSGMLYSAGTAYQDDIYIAKFPASGSVAPGAPLWAKRFGGTGAEIIRSAALDSNGDLLIGGLFTSMSTDLGSGLLKGTGYSGDAFLAKYSGSDGRALWSRAMPCTQEGATTGIAVDAQNNPVITGYFTKGSCNLGTQTFSSVNGSYDIFVAKYAGSSGTPVWAEAFGGAGNETAMSIAIDSANYSVVGGSFEQSTSFGGTTLTSAGLGDAFLLRLDP